MECHHQSASSLLVFTLFKSLLAFYKLAICKIAPIMTWRRFVLLKVFDSFDSTERLNNHFLPINQFFAHI